MCANDQPSELLCYDIYLDQGHMREPQVKSLAQEFMVALGNPDSFFRLEVTSNCSVGTIGQRPV